MYSYVIPSAESPPMEAAVSKNRIALPSWKSRSCLIQRIFQVAEVEFTTINQPTDSLDDTTTPISTRPPSLSDSHEERSLSDTLVTSAEEHILDESYDNYSRTFHMVLLDPNYQIFTSPKAYGSIIYKIEQRTLVVVGDPLCCREDLDALLQELRQFRRARRLKLAFMGVSETFLKVAKEKGWDSFKFGCERVINPMHNAVLDKRAGKRMLSQNRQLLDPKRGKLKMGFYAPSVTGIDSDLEQQLQLLYNDWRYTKEQKGPQDTQAFITAYEIFSQRSKTAFLYTSDSQGIINGMAMVRQLGAECGFHIDPCIASEGAPRGTTDLLMLTTMKLLKKAEISYLSLGVEPFIALEEESSRLNMSGRLAYAAYRKVTNSKSVAGKKAYNDKFHPDPTLESNLYVVFPKRIFPIQEALAIMKVAHIRAINLLL